MPIIRVCGQQEPTKQGRSSTKYRCAEKAWAIKSVPQDEEQLREELADVEQHLVMTARLSKEMPCLPCFHLEAQGYSSY